MQHLLNYKAFNIELLEPHLQEMRRDSTESKTKTAKKSQNKRDRAFKMQGEITW